jgi:CHASE3 domain sensor protein
MWNELSILKKGLVLISVPLLCQLVFAALLADMQYSNAEAARWSIHSKEVLQQTQVVLRNLTELGTGLRGFILAADADLGTAYEQAAKQLPGDILELQNRVRDNPEQLARAPWPTTPCGKPTVRKTISWPCWRTSCAIRSPRCVMPWMC